MAYTLKPLTLKDLDTYKRLTHPSQAYHKYNGPYFKKHSEEEHLAYIKTLAKQFQESGTALPSTEIIWQQSTNQMVGEVSWYWKSKETLWLEIGIIIFSEKYWGQGIGKAVLPLWINKVFSRFPNLIRIGLTTWSGNTRMIRLAEHLGLYQEACYKNARIVDGQYFDSVSFGIQREEWLKANNLSS